MNEYNLVDSLGIYNYGNTCFLNSAFQMLYSINEFRDYILEPKIDINFMIEIYLEQLCDNIYTEYGLNDLYDLDINFELNIIRENIGVIIYRNKLFFNNLLKKNSIKNIFRIYNENIFIIMNNIKIIILKQFNDVNYKKKYNKKFINELWKYNPSKDPKNVYLDKLIDNITKHINNFKNKILLKFKICKILKYIFYMIKNNKNNVISKFNINVKTNIKKLYELKNFRFGDQHDSQEMLNFIIDSITEYIKINSFFCNNYISYSYCKNINTNNIYLEYIKNNNTSFLSIELEKDKNLQDLINKYSFEEASLRELNGIRCGNDSLFIKEYIKILEPNKYIIIQLKRMNYTINGGSYDTESILINKYIIIDGIRYNLLGVILKSGTYKGGHYVYATFKNDKIKIYDDDDIFNYTNILKHCNFINFQHINFILDRNAYLLLYYRNNNIDSKIDQNKNNKIDCNINNNYKINIELINKIKNISKNSICNILKKNFR